MRELQNGNPDKLRAFEARMPGIFPKDNPNAGNQCVIALGQESASEQEEINNVVDDALKQFEQIWGLKSKSFVACNYTWNSPVEKVLLNNRVELIQTDRMQRISLDNNRIRYFSGQCNGKGIFYSIRNCHFEPSLIQTDSLLQNIIDELEQAFKQKTIAVFSTHRVNYVGSIDPSNRNHTLILLDELLTYLTVKYSDLEFLSSDKIVDILNGNQE